MGQSESAWEVRMTLAPFCLVVLVHGMEKLADELPPGKSLKVIVVF